VLEIDLTNFPDVSKISKKDFGFRLLIVMISLAGLGKTCFFSFDMFDRSNFCAL